MMKNSYKTTLGIVGFVVFLLILAGFQTAFLNGFIGVNLILILLLFLIIKQDIFLAVLTAGIGGLFIDTFHYSIFGTTPLILLALTLILITIKKEFFLTSKIELLVMAGVITVSLFRLLEFLIGNGLLFLKSANLESFGLYFWNIGFPTEIILTVVILIILNPKPNAKII